MAFLALSGQTACGGGPKPVSDLHGTWRVTTAVVAPWVASDSAAIDRTSYVARDVHFSATTFDGLTPFACESPAFEATTTPPEGLFQGNLPAPAATATRALGFADGEVRGVELTCASGIFAFHAVDTTHMLVALDNAIWTLDRSPGALAADSTPEAVVQRLLETHWAGDRSFDTATVGRLTPYLTPTLVAQITGYLAMPVSANEAPSIDGDPFTDAQEYPTRFSVQAATMSAGSTTQATVDVRFADGWSSRSLQYQLQRSPSGWRVEDIAYGQGSTFVGQLRSAK